MTACGSGFRSALLLCSVRSALVFFYFMRFQFGLRILNQLGMGRCRHQQEQEKGTYDRKKPQDSLFSKVGNYLHFLKCLSTKAPDLPSLLTDLWVENCALTHLQRARVYPNWPLAPQAHPARRNNARKSTRLSLRRFLR